MYVSISLHDFQTMIIHLSINPSKIRKIKCIQQIIFTNIVLKRGLMTRYINRFVLAFTTIRKLDIDVTISIQYFTPMHPYFRASCSFSKLIKVDNILTGQRAWHPIKQQQLKVKQLSLKCCAQSSCSIQIRCCSFVASSRIA